MWNSKKVQSLVGESLDLEQSQKCKLVLLSVLAVLSGGPMSSMCEINFERMLLLLLLLHRDQQHSRTFQKKKNFLRRYNRKKLSTVESHYGRALSKTSGEPLKQPEKKGLSDLVKRSLQTVMSNRVLLKGDVVSARRACCACCAIPQIEPGRRLRRQWR